MKKDVEIILEEKPEYFIKHLSKDYMIGFEVDENTKIKILSFSESDRLEAIELEEKINKLAEQIQVYLTKNYSNNNQYGYFPMFKKLDEESYGVDDMVFKVNENGNVWCTNKRTVFKNRLPLVYLLDASKF